MSTIPSTDNDLPFVCWCEATLRIPTCWSVFTCHACRRSWSRTPQGWRRTRALDLIDELYVHASRAIVDVTIHGRTPRD